MSLNLNGDRLLAEALAEAMDRDLTDVPPKEQLEKQHRFSGRFVRRIKKIEAGKGETRDFRRPGSRAMHYGTLAAMLACVISLAAVLRVSGSFFRMGASKSEGMNTAADESAPEEAADAGFESDSVADAADAGDDGADMSSDVESAAGDDAADSGDAKMDAAPGWQEQLLAESARADELAVWLLSSVYDDGTIDLESALVTQGADAGNAQSQMEKTVRISRVYEVYYESSTDEWERVYHTDREMVRHEPDMTWEDNYSLAELNMNRPGRYRLVRQVNNFRQVLALTLD